VPTPPDPVDDVFTSRRLRNDQAGRTDCAQGHGDNAEIMTDALTWAGTYHGIGARMLREYAEQIGSDSVFTIHGREDSADLMNLVKTLPASTRPEPH
jgi:DNA helicase-2/ATP-dependent DNA helicase PcrA